MLDVHDHRPWPLPAGPWLMAQTWNELLFAHWPVPVDALRARVPAGLTIDTFDGRAYLGVTPFHISGLRLHGMPSLGRLSRFPELNVRTYVVRGDRPGIWFFSLDAASAAAVVAARLAYRLPYFHADMAVEHVDGGIRYESRRGAARLRVAYAPTGPPAAPVPGTLEHWLTERYRLYTQRAGRLRHADIHHPPWPLQPAAATFADNTMAPVPLPGGAPLLHYARRQDVVIWPPARTR